MEPFERLKQVAQNGETITVVYHGGSQPGRKRILQPIMVTPRVMKARDPTGEEKIFILSKVEIVTPESPIPEYIPGKVTDKKPLSILEGLQGSLEELRRIGWHVDISENAILLYDRFNNGKLRKNPTVGIKKQIPQKSTEEIDEMGPPERNEVNGPIKEASFVMRLDRINMIFETEMKITKRSMPPGRSRPWSVFGPGGFSSYSHLDKAIAMFWLHARIYPPQRPEKE